MRNVKVAKSKSAAVKTAINKKNEKAEKAGAKASPSRKNELIKQVAKLAKELNEEGLQILLQQAQVLRHNMEVMASMKDRKKIEIVEQMRGKIARGDKFTIDVKEADDNSYFILIINNARNFFSRDEMRQLARMCQAAQNESEASQRLFAWFSQKRKDVLFDTSIDGVKDPALITMYNFIKNRYTVKEGA